MQRRERAVAMRRKNRQDHVPLLLDADVEPALAHPFEDVALADLGAFEPQPLAGEEAFEAEVRHHGREDAAAVQPPLPCPARAAPPPDLVAADVRAASVDHDPPD